MKRKNAVLAIVLSVLCSTAFAAEPPIRFGVDPTFPPFESRDPSGQLVGFDIEIGEAICAELQTTCDWQIINFDGAIPALNAKKIDGILSGFTITEQRSKQVDFSSPLYSTASRIMTQKKNDFETTAEALKGKHIGIVQGTSQAAYANKHWRNKGINLVSYQNDDLAKQDLALGRIDGTLQNAASAEVFFETPDGADFHLTGEPIVDVEVFGVGTGIGIRKDDTERLEKINQAVATIRANGLYDEILERYSKYGVLAPITD